MSMEPRGPTGSAQSTHDRRPQNTENSRHDFDRLLMPDDERPDGWGATSWLGIYRVYLWIATAACAVALARYSNAGLAATIFMGIRLGLYALAAYSITRLRQSWARRYHLGLNGVAAACALGLMLGADLPFVWVFSSLTYVPLYSLIPDFLLDESLYNTLRLFSLVAFVTWVVYLKKLNDLVAQSDSLGD